MLKINSSSTPATNKATPNLLPCQISHDGPVSNPSQYWQPTSKEDGTHEAYLRGRKLQGRDVKLPAGYEGIVTQDGGVQQKAGMYDHVEQDEEEEQEEIGILNQVGAFDRVLVWEHERVAEDEDAFVRGVGEWIGFAETLHKPGREVEVAK